MPFKSEAQRRKFANLVQKGQISQKVFDEWESATPAEIPERISSKKNKQTKPEADASKLKRRFGL